MILEEQIKQDVQDLQLFSQAINGNRALTDQEEDILVNIIDRFKDHTKSAIIKHFEGYLKSEECEVFCNFHKSIYKIIDILDTLKEGKQVSKKELRGYLFKNKNINKILFSDTFRDILDYIQVELNTKVKAELLSDLYIYFDTGCFEEDKNNNKYFKESLERKNITKQEIFELIKNKSQERNIGVEAILNPMTGERTVKISDNFLNKFDMAKSGFIDCVKITPKGFVISMTTADGKISNDQEKQQLEKHLSCLEFGILKSDFKYISNGREITVKSIDEIAEVRFCVVTEYTADNSLNIQNILHDLGIDNEKLTFLHSCMSNVIKSYKMSDELKSKIKFEGYACEGISNKDLNNLDELIIRDIDKLVQNSKKIIEAKETVASEAIQKYFNSLADFLMQSAEKIHVKDYTKLCRAINKLCIAFNETNCFGAGVVDNLKIFYMEELLPQRHKSYREQLLKAQTIEYNKQMSIVDKKTENQQKIIEILKPYVDTDLIISKARFNHTLKNKYKFLEKKNKDKSSLKIINQIIADYNIHFRKKSDENSHSYANFSFIERLYIENALPLSKTLKDHFDFDNSILKTQLPKYREDPLLGQCVILFEEQNPKNKTKTKRS